MKKNYLFSVTFMLLTLTIWAQAPNISYSTPQTYTVGTAITPLAPTNIGGSIQYSDVFYTYTFAGSSTTTAGAADGNLTSATFNKPNTVAIDSQGNMFVGDYSNYTIRIGTPGDFGDMNGTGANAQITGVLGMAIDRNDNIYFGSNGTIKKVSPAGVMTTYVGNFFNIPKGMCFDSNGNLFVADFADNSIKKVSPSGIVTTFAGNNSGCTGQPCSIDGTGTGASFYYPNDLTIDNNDNIYVAESNGRKIRKITPSGVVTTLAGGGTSSNFDADGIGTNAKFSSPYGICFDRIGNLFMTDTNLCKIKKVTTDNGTVSTIAGNAGVVGSANGTGVMANFSSPQGICMDKYGNLFVADSQNNQIRKLTQIGAYNIYPALPAGLTFDPTTGIISGTPTQSILPTTFTITVNNGFPSTTTVILTINQASYPNISYQSPQNYTVGAAITPLTPTNIGAPITNVGDVIVSTYAGTGVSGSDNGTINNATFLFPQSIVFDSQSNMYVSEIGGGKSLIRKITPSGVVSTLAGDIQGYIDGTGISANFTQILGMGVDSSDNIYAADFTNNKIRKITPTGDVTTYAGSGTFQGSQNGTDGTVSTATFGEPAGILFDSSSTMYVADYNTSKVRKITTSGNVSTFAGSYPNGFANGNGTNAKFYGLQGICMDSFSNIYVTESVNNRIRKITPSGDVTTFAGTGTAGADDGNVNIASFNNPLSICMDKIGNFYVADYSNAKIRKITPSGTVSTYAGTGVVGNNDGLASMATFGYPGAIAFNNFGDLFVADDYNHKIRKISKCGFTIYPPLPAGLIFDAITGTISGTPTQVIPPTTFTVTANNLIGSCVTTLILSTSNLATDTFETQGFKIYPNPAKTILNIQSNNNVTIDKVILTDMTGKKVMETTQTNAINIEALSSGMYIIQAYSADAKHQSKFIKE